MRSDLHRVEETLQLADLIGIAPVAEVVAPRAEPAAAAPSGPYAVLHAAPFFRYKQWHSQGWRKVAQHLAARGLAVVATGGPSPEERAYLDGVWDGVEISRLDGALGWAQLTCADPGRSRLPGPRYVGDASCRSHRLPDRGAVRSDRSAPLGAVAGRRPARAICGPWNRAAAGQCLRGAKSAAGHAVRPGGLPAKCAQSQPLSRPDVRGGCNPHA